MILFLFDFLERVLGLRIPTAFGYYSTRMMLAAMTALLLSIFLGPRFIRKLQEWKIGQSIRNADCAALLSELHKSKQNTPTMGGVLILFSMLVSMALWMDLTHVFTLILFITTLVLGALGAYDDYRKLRYKNHKGLSGKKKLLIQFAMSGLVALYLLHPGFSEMIHVGEWYAPPVIKEYVPVKLYADPQEPSVIPTSTTYVPVNISLQEYASRLYLPFFKEPVLVLSGFFVLLAALFILFVVTGSSNAVNLTDGLDGLAAGCLVMVASCLALIAFLSNHTDIANYLHILYIEGSGEIAIYLSAFAGACLGFMWYNGYPAQVFMGDTGSLALGGILGVSAVLLRREFLLAIIGGIFVAETLSVIMQVMSYRLRNKKRIFLCTPLHHHFEYQGWPETKVVLRFWIVGLLLGIIGLVSLKFQ